MDAFSDAEIVKLGVLSAAFVVGLLVCVYVVIRESIELKNRRKAKELMYRDAVHREVQRKKMEAQEAASETEGDKSSFRSFA